MPAIPKAEHRVIRVLLEMDTVRARCHTQVEYSVAHGPARSAIPQRKDSVFEYDARGEHMCIVKGTGVSKGYDGDISVSDPSLCGIRRSC